MDIANTPAAAGNPALDRLNTPSRPSGQGGLGSLGQADFLRLLTTQLQFQDPLEPVNNEQMLAQMAQFSALAAKTESAATLTQISRQMDQLIIAQEASAAANAAAIAGLQASLASAPPSNG
ncbi:MAG: flagellar hook assembly protein FlgD [Erythrobacter sp.]